MDSNKSELGEREELNPIDDAAELPQSEGETVTENDGTADNLPVEDDVMDENIATSSDEMIQDDAPVEDPAEVADSAVEAALDSSEMDDDVVAAQDEEPLDEVEDSAEAESSAPATEVPAQPAKFKRGDVLDGTIVSTSPTSVMVDIGKETIGIIPGRELERMSRPMLEALKENEPITVYVVNPSDHQGNTILSVNRALEELDWRQAREYRESQAVYDGQVAGYNKGGLIVRFGRLRGFVPQSQVSDDRRRQMSGETPEERYSPMVNSPIAVKVMEVDRSRNRLILSERAAYREVREQRKESLVQELEVGEVRQGRVVSLEEFGAFVDVGGAEGLVHLTELSWRHVNHPRDVLRVGQEVTVEVISVDRDRKRIGLSIKRQLADPWDVVATEYNVGQLVQGSITKLTKFGAFAQLVDAPEIEGLVHISELSDLRVNHPREVVNEGDKLTLRVVKIDVKNRRLGLSLKRVNSAEYLDIDLKKFASDSDSD